MIRLVLALLAVAALAGCQQTGSSSSSSSSTSTGATATPSTAQPAPQPGTAPGEQTSAKEVSLPSGLHYQDLVVGDGALAESGSQVAVHYTGWLTDGTQFDSSRNSGQPLQFQIGAGSMIRGMEDGVRGMRVGGKRKLRIPPDLAYGSSGMGGVIPPDATLIFDVELLNVR